MLLLLYSILKKVPHLHFLFTYQVPASLQWIYLQEADLEFASSLASLLKTIERAIQVHEDFSGVVNPAELLVCRFTGIKVIVHKYSYL